MSKSEPTADESAGRPPRRRRRRLVLYSALAVLSLGGVTLCSARVDRVTDTHVWAYDFTQLPRSGLRMEIEAAKKSLSGKSQGPWRRVASAVADAEGRTVLRRERRRRLSFPYPHSGGPAGYAQRLLLDGIGAKGAVVDVSGSRAAQIAMGDRDHGYVLTFEHDYDAFRDDDAFSRRCARRVEELATRKPFIVDSSKPNLGSRTRALVADEARAMGMDALPGGHALTLAVDTAPAVTCSAHIFLRDLQGNPVEGFSSPEAPIDNGHT